MRTSPSSSVPSNRSPELAGALGASIGFVIGTILGRWMHGRTAAAKSLITSRPPYKPRQKATLPSPDFGQNVRVFDPSILKSCYNLMISTVVPRPIALVSSRNKESGIDNVAPFSYFGAVAHDPPMLAIGFCRKGGVQKDSLVNILSSKEFAVNLISEWYLDTANHSCGIFKPEVDEFMESGLTKAECVEVAAPRVKEAAVTYECRLEHVQEVKNDDGTPTTEIVLARVVCIHVDKEVLVENFDPVKPAVDTSKLRPVGRLGGNIYCSIGETVDIPRPKVS
jgi:flavin reductase (DIM6/NTAB) family NADH-FMN oxidoreductase RutF